MSSTSSIEWTDATWNPTRGCTKVSPGCKHCYAETFAERWRGVPGHAYERGFDLRLAPEMLAAPLGWKKPRKVFVNSMSDLFHEDVPDEYIAAVFGVMAAAPQHTFQVLTKRAERLQRWFAWAERHAANVNGSHHPMPIPFMALAYAQKQTFAPELRQVVDYVAARPWPLPNVWIGVSAENQDTADERVPHLLATPAAVRFVSAEPLLGPIRFDRLRDDEIGARWNALEAGIGWVIVGGESGTKARPFDLAWGHAIVEQCRAAGVPVFVKQLGARPGTARSGLIRLASRKGGDPDEWPEELRVREWPR